MKINKKGISLPELLAVIVIMGLIAAISIPAFSSMIKNSKKDKVISEVKNLVSKVDTMIKDTNTDLNVGDSISISMLKDIQSDYNGDIPLFIDDTEEQLETLVKDKVFYYQDYEHEVGIRIDGHGAQNYFDFDNHDCPYRSHLYKVASLSHFDLITRACIA